MKILLLSRYGHLGASSRLRMYQYLPYLNKAGVDVTVSPLLDDDYIEGLYANNIQKLSVIKAYFKRIFFMLNLSKFDLVWVEKEMLPWLPGWIEVGLFPSKIPLIVDYDDAVFHRYDQHKWSIVRSLLGQKIDQVMRRANLVIAGNQYLADRAQLAGAVHVKILPTVVDIARYQVLEDTHNATLIIGWIGSPATAHFLREIVQALTGLVTKNKYQIVAVGANPAQLKDLPIKVLPWSEETEVASIQQFDIGIMPLTDGLFERGKCGYKLIQYMACGKPVIASPVGVNTQIVQHGENGFLATSASEWKVAITQLIEDASLRKRMGDLGRHKVEADYSLHTMADKLVRLMQSKVAS
ncbi:MAG TPA: glycosyltransferase family 4 protein [Methylophilus sp.]